MKKVIYIFSLVMIVAILLSSSVQAQERKRWSPQAKGTVIGAGAGAVTGAVINKRNRAVGGVVGGVVGGAAGYAIGKHKDNKNKEAARVAAANRAAAERAAANRAAANKVAVEKKSAAPATEKEEVVANKTYPAVTAYNSLGAVQPAMLYDANGNPLPQIINASYLPNPTYGDPAKPYSNYEYRRKSW